MLRIEAENGQDEFRCRRIERMGNRDAVAAHPLNRYAHDSGFRRSETQLGAQRRHAEWIELDIFARKTQ